MCFSVAIVREKQLRKLFVDADPQKKTTHFNYMSDDVLKQRGESHQDRNKIITYIFLLKR